MNHKIYVFDTHIIKIARAISYTKIKTDFWIFLQNRGWVSTFFKITSGEFMLAQNTLLVRILAK